MLTKKELANYLKVDVRTVDRYRKSGMPFKITVTGLIRFELEEVLSWFLADKKKGE